MSDYADVNVPVEVSPSAASEAISPITMMSPAEAEFGKEAGVATPVKCIALSKLYNWAET